VGPVRGIFASWTQALVERLELAGLRPSEAADLAFMLLMLLEGAHVLCRAAGTLEPLEQATRTATVLAQTRYRTHGTSARPNG